MTASGLQISTEIQQYIDLGLTHQIHTSGRKAFRACRRRWNWVYNDMYSPVVQAEPLEFGIAFHKAMETFYEPRTWLSPREIRRDLALVAFTQECKRHLKEYQRLEPDPDVTVLESYKTRIELGQNMLRYYCDQVSPLYDNNWTPIRVEVGFEVPITDLNSPRHCNRPECDVCVAGIAKHQLWCKCKVCWDRFYKYVLPGLGKNQTAFPINWEQEWAQSDGTIRTTRELLADGHHRVINWKGLPVTYGGRIDALFQDQHGRYWIADWKTTSRLLDEDAESSFLQLDDQIVSYLWALEQYGIHCAGFVYVEIKKAFPQAPEKLSRSYKGRSFSTNKQSLTTYDLFLGTIQQQDYEAWQMGMYDDYLIRLRNEGPKFTQRHQVHKNPHEIAEAGKVIALETMDMIDPNLRIYPQPGRFSCNWCLFKQPCLGMNMGEDYLYTLDTMFDKRSYRYWEEKEASTD